MVTIGKDLRLDDRHYPGALADGGVASEDIGVLEDGELGGAVLLDLEDATPLGEVAAVLLVLDAAGLKVVETLGGALVVGAEERHDTLVDLDARDDVALLEQLGEGPAVGGLLVEGLVEQDHTGHVVADLSLECRFRGYWIIGLYRLVIVCVRVSQLAVISFVLIFIINIGIYLSLTYKFTKFSLNLKAFG